MKQLFILISVSFFLFHCKKEASQKTQKQINKSSIRYAKGFDLIEENGQQLLIIKKVFQSSAQQFRYVLSNENNISENKIKVPVEKLVVTSTTHIPMIELLESEQNIVGFPNTKYISSEKTRKLVDSGKIKEIGSEQNMNTEVLMDLYPELVVGFSLHPNNKLYTNIEKMNIPVIYNGDWLEETPLGRAEWIKFFGALLDKQKLADSIFKNIEKEYLKATQIAKSDTEQPTVLSGSLFKDVWSVPAGQSFIATFFKDANLNYLWKNTEGNGSLQLSLESVLDKGQQADFWIGAGLFESKKQLLQNNKMYQNFKAFNNDKVFGVGQKKGKTGGYIYFELAPVRPDLVLKDLIKITNPQLLPDYKLFFFQKL